MGGAQGERGQQVGAFRWLGSDGAETDGPGLGRQLEKAAFRVGFSRHYNALAVVGIHGVGREGN